MDLRTLLLFRAVVGVGTMHYLAVAIFLQELLAVHEPVVPSLAVSAVCGVLFWASFSPRFTASRWFGWIASGVYALLIVQVAVTSARSGYEAPLVVANLLVLQVVALAQPNHRGLIATLGLFIFCTLMGLMVAFLSERIDANLFGFLSMGFAATSAAIYVSLWLSFDHEAELVESNRSLETAIDQLVSSEAKVQMANVALARRNSDLEEFASVVSHDLKAPLVAIGRLVDWVREDLESGDTEELQRHSELLRNRKDRLIGLIDGLLVFARAGRAGGDVVEIDPRLLARQVAQRAKRGCTGEVRTEVRSGLIFADRVQLMRVLQNLVTNGLVHNDKGAEALVTLTLEESEDAWRFTVADNGPGIAAQYHEIIFGVFKTLQPRDTFDSTGIGLSVARKVVRAVGGAIRVESSPGTGATFVVDWPKPSEGSADAPSVRAERAPMAPVPESRTGT